MDSQGEATQLLRQLTAGDKNALDQLIPQMYDELRTLASHYLHQERPDRTLCTTELVREAYLRLIEQREAQYSDRAPFKAAPYREERREAQTLRPQRPGFALTSAGRK